MSTSRPATLYECFWDGCSHSCPKKSGIARHSAQCDFKPASKEALLAKFTEKKTRVWLCEYCEMDGKLRAFGRPSDAVAHKKRHLKDCLPDDEYHNCQYCSYKTADKSNFKTHQKHCQDPNLGLRSGRRTSK